MEGLIMPILVIRSLFCHRSVLTKIPLFCMFIKVLAEELHAGAKTKSADTPNQRLAGFFVPTLKR